MALVLICFLLQVSNLHPDMKEGGLKELFSPFGEVTNVHIVRDAAGSSTGEAFVQVSAHTHTHRHTHTYITRTHTNTHTHT
jgi:hypothetical protein